MQGVAWQAVYEKAADETESAPDSSQRETWGLHILETPGAAECIQTEQQIKKAKLQISLEQVVFSVGIILILLPLLWISIQRHQKRSNTLKK